MDLKRTLQTQEIRSYVEGCLNVDLSFRTRKRDAVYARAVYFKLCKEYTKLSLADIGASVNVDHATVLHGIKNVFPVVIEYDGYLRDVYQDYKFSNKHEPENIFENYSRLLRENIELRTEIENVKEGIMDRRFIDLYNDIPKSKKEDVYTKLDAIVKVAKVFHEKDTVQS